MLLSSIGLWRLNTTYFPVFPFLLYRAVPLLGRKREPTSAFSKVNNLTFRSSPPAYPVRLPLVPTTRWHGIRMEIGLCPTAPPTAWGTSAGYPAPPPPAGQWRHRSWSAHTEWCGGCATPPSETRFPPCGWGFPVPAPVPRSRGQATASPVQTAESPAPPSPVPGSGQSIFVRQTTPCQAVIVRRQKELSQRGWILTGIVHGIPPPHKKVTTVFFLIIPQDFCPRQLDLSSCPGYNSST